MVFQKTFTYHFSFICKVKTRYAMSGFTNDHPFLLLMNFLVVIFGETHTEGFAKCSQLFAPLNFTFWAKKY